MNTAKIVKASLIRVKVAVVCGVIAFALTSAMPPQGGAVDLPLAGPTCSAPASEAERARCARLERQILDATVFLRFTLHCGPGGNQSAVALVPSHATIKDSRTLVTHDHFFPLADPACTATALEVATSDGVLLVEIEDSVELASLVLQLQPESKARSRQIRTLVFPESLFTPAAGLSFATFDGLAAGDAPAGWGELAQVDWAWANGSTHIQWARPLNVERRGAALGLVTGKAVEIGASGGGVFGVTPAGLVHIGNIWGTWQDDDTSIIALNQVAALTR